MKFFKDSMPSIYAGYDTIYELSGDSNKMFPYKYAVGVYPVYNNAKTANDEIKKNISGSFVIKYGGEKLQMVSVNDMNLRSLIYRVQIASSPNQVLPEFFSSRYNIHDTIFLYQDKQKQFKYAVGNFKSYQLANDYKKEFYSKYQLQCFITPYFNGKRISFDKLVKIAHKSGIK